MQFDYILPVLYFFCAIGTLLLTNPILAMMALFFLNICQSIIYMKFNVSFMPAAQAFFATNLIIIFYLFFLILFKKQRVRKIIVHEKFFSLLGIIILLLFLGILILIIDDNYEYLLKRLNEVERDSNLFSSKEMLKTLFNNYSIPFKLISVIVLSTTFTSFVLIRNFVKSSKQGKVK